jgi:hypothetical protein
MMETAEELQAKLAEAEEYADAVARINRENREARQRMLLHLGAAKGMAERMARLLRVVFAEADPTEAEWDAVVAEAFDALNAYEAWKGAAP